MLKIINKENKLTLVILLAIIAFLSFNVLNKNIFKNLRFDLTKSNVYTLSDGTKSILKSINEPLDFKLFYTKQIGDINPIYQNYYDRVKETLEQYALDNRLTWITDTSNKDSYFTRNWLRLDLIPQLQVRWPHVEHTLAKTAMHCQEAQQLLEELAWQDYQAVALDKQLSLLKLQTLSYARLKNVLRYWLNKHDLSPPDTQKLHAMATIFFTAKTDGLPEIIHETSVIRCYQHHLYIVPRARCKPKSQAWVDFPAPLHLTADLGQLTVNSDALVPVNAPDLHIRFRQGGERIYHHSHHKCLKKCLQAWRVPPWERARIPLLYSCDQLLAVIGYMYSDDYPKILGKHTKIMWHKSSNQHSG